MVFDEFSFRYETESAGKIEELEHAKMKLQARLAEAEDTIEGIFRTKMHVLAQCVSFTFT